MNRDGSKRETRLLKAQASLKYLLELPAVYEGSLSKVYRAQDLSLNRTVCVKEIDCTKFSRKERSTLQSEITVWCDYARKTMKMPQFFYTFEADNKSYIVMQWIEGKTLRSAMEEKKTGFWQKLDYCIQLCDALAPIHRERKQHKDLKPENIQIANDHRIYLMDFNISAAVPHVGTGTDGYLAPERSGISLQSSACRVDIFAIGVIMYELFTGCIPVFGLDYVCEPQDKEWQFYVKPSEKTTGLPAGLDRIIERCMALQWKDRYPDAAAVGRDLRNIKKTLKNQGGKKG